MGLWNFHQLRVQKEMIHMNSTMPIAYFLTKFIFILVHIPSVCYHSQYISFISPDRNPLLLVYNSHMGESINKNNQMANIKTPDRKYSLTFRHSDILRHFDQATVINQHTYMLQYN